MEVRSGWNSEFARKKYDVTLDEADLSRILDDAGIPLEAQPKLSIAQAHALLYFSAEILARTTLKLFDPSMKESLDKEITALTEQRSKVLTLLKKKHE